MLTELITQRHVRAWHQGTLFAPYLDGYLEELAAQGFNRHALCQKVCAASFFAEHLRRQGVQVIADIADAHVEDFAVAQGRERGVLAWLEAI
jgi:hypothetical protein